MARGREQQAGLDFEDRFAALFGVKPTPGSGNQWYAKLDVGARELLCSLKHTGKESFKLTKAVLREAIQEATKMGSKGAIPLVAVDIAGEDFVIIRTNDFAALLEEDAKFVPVKRSDAKRRRASIPAVLRQPEDDWD